MRYLTYIISLLLLTVATGCVDDALPLDGTGEEKAHGGPYTLTFTVGVPAMDDGAPRTRAIYYGNPLYYEDWIDTQDGFRILFFITKREKTGASAVDGKYEDTHNFVAVDPLNPLKDYFLFESTSRWITQLPYDDDGNLRYRVTVPVYQIGKEDVEYRDYWERIRELLRTYDFKVAVMANHPSDTFRWGIENSVLSAPDIDNLSTASPKLKTINDIHHSVEDPNYATNTNASRKNAYNMLVDKDNNAMGPFIDWVTARSLLYGDALGGNFNTKETARAWIRNFWRPEIEYNEDTDPDIDYKTLYHNYRHIWLYWNFGGAAPDNGLPYSTKSTTNVHIGKWEERNGSLLRSWVTEAAQNDGRFQRNLDTSSKGDDKYDGAMPLKLSVSNARGVITEGNGALKFYGVTLPALSSVPTSTGTADCFQFTLNAHCTIVVRYVSTGGGTIYLSNGAKVNADATTTVTYNGLKVKEAVFSQNIMDTPKAAYIYSSGGESTVYDIEVLQDQYVYLTDREGILPSSDHPIPMYGVQKYGKLAGWWDEGASFDLTQGGQNEDGVDYATKTISLLRAVAKIEVLIPKSLGVPKHVYMHSLNRNVRCEPMDVSTPTNELWKDHNNGCEWTTIQARGTMYDNGKYETTAYKRKVAWYYGNWLEWGWGFNGMSELIPDYGKDGPFPRIMNPYINRADCAAFIDVTDYYNDQFYHFLFYMGENTLDAPTTYDGSSGGPTVPRILIRFDQRYASTSKVATNSDLNLFGNDCYRIYFTDGGIAPGARDANGVSKINPSSYDSQYENKPEYLKYHWPVIRNHVYRFTLVDNGGSGMNGIVVDAQNRSADFNFK